MEMIIATPWFLETINYGSEGRGPGAGRGLVVTPPGPGLCLSGLGNACGLTAALIDSDARRA